MAANTGFNFINGTVARPEQVNENFAWFRGNFIPVTQSGTWATINGANNLGSASFHWKDAYIETFPSTDSARITNLTCTTANITTANITNLTNTNANITNLTVTSHITVSGAVGATPAVNTIYKENIINGWLSYVQFTPAIENDFNVSTVTDSALGDYTINWDTDFANATYACVVSPLNAAGIHHASVVSRTAGTTRILTANVAHSLVDIISLSIAIGDQ